MHLSSLLLHYVLISVAHSLICLLRHSLSDSLIKNTDFPHSTKASFFLITPFSLFFERTYTHWPPKDLKLTEHKTTTTLTHTPSSLALDLSKDTKKLIILICLDYA